MPGTRPGKASSLWSPLCHWLEFESGSQDKVERRISPASFCLQRGAEIASGVRRGKMLQLAPVIDQVIVVSRDFL
jgi:hypothetical protein